MIILHCLNGCKLMTVCLVMKNNIMFRIFMRCQPGSYTCWPLNCCKNICLAIWPSQGNLSKSVWTFIVWHLKSTAFWPPSPPPTPNGLIRQGKKSVQSNTDLLLDHIYWHQDLNVCQAVEAIVVHQGLGSPLGGTEDILWEELHGTKVQAGIMMGMYIYSGNWRKI